MAISVVAALGFLLFFSGLTKGYDSTLPAYLICTFLLLIYLIRYKILDTVALAKDNVVDEFSDGLIVLDNNDKMIYANQQVREIYPELAGENYGTVLSMLEQLYNNGEKLFLEQKVYEIHKKDILKDGVYYGKMLVVSDITEGYNYTIELEKQTSIAEQANKAKSIFLAKMSHEIRTPINAIIGMNEMILRESRENDIKQYATDIKVSANTLLDIVNDILDSSKIESGKLSIMPVTYALQDLLSNVVNLFSLKAKGKMLKFEVVVDEKLPCKQFGDDARLRQILVNLLNNAIKYTNEGSITLRVSGKRMESAVLMHYEIEDTGIGIKEEDLPKLCDAFVRLEESKNRNIEGTGLGMTIVVELLRMMNSQLQVESVYGKGSTFSFDVIQGVVSGAPMGRFRMNTIQNIEEYKALFTAPRAKILVVDDNEVNRKVFGNLLKKTLVQITDLDSGEKCLERIQKEHFDLIFLDYMMPNMDGVETLHRMKQLDNNQCAGVPVIILTADAVSDARERYLGKGFDDFLSKPVAGVDLERMIQKYLPAELMEA
jgi:signal transduction histidine kinase/CheY-like chemotaxis protein